MAHEQTSQLVARVNGPDKPATFLGLRGSALKEVLLFISAALILDLLVGAGDRLAGLSPHPFWIAVLLSTSYYGTNEGLAAAALSTAALLVGNVPDQAINEDLATWLLRITTQPVLWFITALVLGEICVARRQEAESLHEEVRQHRAQADVIAGAYQQLAESQRILELHITSQQRTVRQAVTAAQAIEQSTRAEVLRNVPELVRTVLSPQKFSLFLVEGHTLELAVAEGWEPSDTYWRSIAYGPLLDAIMDRRETLIVSDRLQEQRLCGQGLMAAPLIEQGTGKLIGMLKVEKISFDELTVSAVMDFLAICRCIGNAHEKASRSESHAPASRAIESYPASRFPIREVDGEAAGHLPQFGSGRLGGANGRTRPATDGLSASTRVEIETGRGTQPAAKRRTSP